MTAMCRPDPTTCPWRPCRSVMCAEHGSPVNTIRTCPPTCIHFQHDGDTQDVCLSQPGDTGRACEDIDPDTSPGGYDYQRERAGHWVQDCEIRPWNTAENHYTIDDNGLLLPWEGRVWLNPPYGRECRAWLDRMAAHRNGISLVFARTETAMFQDLVFPVANALLFISGRVKFYHVNGEQGESSTAPSVLIAYGERNANVLESCGIAGAFVWLRADDALVTVEGVN